MDIWDSSPEPCSPEASLLEAILTDLDRLTAVTGKTGEMLAETRRRVFGPWPQPANLPGEASNADVPSCFEDRAARAISRLKSEIARVEDHAAVLSNRL